MFFMYIMGTHIILLKYAFKKSYVTENISSFLILKTFILNLIFFYHETLKILIL